MRHIGRAFTLVELMITVAIVAVLTAIALPMVNDYTRRARAAEMLINRPALRMAVQAYAAGEGSSTALATSEPYPMDMDKDLHPWDPAPAAFSTLGWAPDGWVRCGYSFRIWDAMNPPAVVAAFCDVDNDDIVLQSADRWNPSSTASAVGDDMCYPWSGGWPPPPPDTTCISSEHDCWWHCN